MHIMLHNYIPLTKDTKDAPLRVGHFNCKHLYSKILIKHRFFFFSLILTYCFKINTRGKKLIKVL